MPRLSRAAAFAGRVVSDGAAPESVAAATASSDFAGLKKLYSDIDAKFRTAAPKLQCRAGCSGCCVGGIRVSKLEAKFIEAHVSDFGFGDLPLGVTAKGPQLGPRRRKTPCAFLTPAGGCSIYAARPAVCRSHGPAQSWTERGSEAEYRDVCQLNEASVGDVTALAASRLYDIDAETERLRQLHFPHDGGHQDDETHAKQVDRLHAVSLTKLHAKLEVSSTASTAASPSATSPMSPSRRRSNEESTLTRD
ncbi:hypothetical protein M885DRAFT_528634 [Pelagophyceae sp. CCMP2097]|nr:hypothetical protein M885DRAFT_528634 [Pelagophyceae sp. CCMP2097]|mmetsp:Transcript_30407/g.102616  ORF Transcript_30407/g.102616 Transcript_30407/m.102616 type:complete len:250 (+) Transcript_30407:50-799(+)